MPFDALPPDEPRPERPDLSLGRLLAGLILGSIAAALAIGMLAARDGAAVVVPWYEGGT